MSLCQSLGHFGRVAHELVPGKGTARELLSQGHALHALHRDVWGALVLADLVNRDDVRMVQH